jgi:outer membrane cobalamin receptor
LWGTPCAAQLASISGVVRDPDSKVVPGVAMHVAAQAGQFRADALTDDKGRYVFSALDPGRYRVTARLSGFKTANVDVLVAVRQPATVDVRLELGEVSESVTVGAVSEALLPARSETLITRDEAWHVPGGLQIGSYAALLDTTPSTVMSHDLLHVRGGHQVSFEVDGVPVPSSTVGTNLALLFDPKNLSALEFQRGSYPASVGEGMFGVFNVVTRSGFERGRGGDAVIIAGQQGTIDAAVGYGDHSDRIAYFAQGSGNRTDFGLTPSSPEAVHNEHTGAGAAGKLWTVPSKNDLLTATASLRADNYEIPYDPAAASGGPVQDERNGFVNGLWTRTVSASTVVSFAPYYATNRIQLMPGPAGGPFESSDDRRTRYGGAKFDWSRTTGPHSFQAGTNVYGASLIDAFSLPLGDAPEALTTDAVHVSGLNAGLYLQDRFAAASNVSIDAGLRWDLAHATSIESALQPRLGVSIRVPSTDLTVHAYAGRLFQPPPLAELGVAGSLAAAAAGQSFTTILAERGALYEAGLTWARKGAVADVTYYCNVAHNYLDHEQLGDSALFLPVNIEEARLRGLEVSVASSSTHVVHGRFAYAYGHAEGRGDITGGLGDISASDGPGGYYPLDHDQRHTASLTIEFARQQEPWWVSGVVRYESGFPAGEGGGHLPGHTTVDVAGGWRLSTRLDVVLEGQNLTNARYAISLGSEFSGTHYGRPRCLLSRVAIKF